ncbi:MAG: hypothetical protein DI529_02895 [Chryseobacterium sp.]|nr:MAG: hypothetical protein DI529_02895 [Chryseobacterium sp.]
MGKIYLFVLIGISVFFKTQVVNIPDANFKAYLVGNPLINTNNDNDIQISEANAFTGTISCYSRNITNLTGIEAFVNLAELNCANNQITSLDLSKNTFLSYLNCLSNQLTNLDLSKNTALTGLYCVYNQIINLDISKNTNLTTLLCYNNKIKNLDISQNLALTTLSCGSNQLTSIDVSKNTALEGLYVDYNQLTNIDVSKNTVLTDLYCSNNQLTHLDVSQNKDLRLLGCAFNQIKNLDISNNIALKNLSCGSNQLTNLDVSKITNLTDLYCYSNQLKSLDLKNGQNSKIENFSSTNNPNLTCIQVDNVDYANSQNNWDKDQTANYDINCILSTNDTIKKEIVISPNPVQDILHFSEEISSVKITDVSGRLVTEILIGGKSGNFSNLAKGVYILTIITKSGEVQTKKIVKK